ncbi:MAG: single-stranded-DNA-specific exonuclease RecJ [Candidatus Levybacteria bacterium RIFCSPHIGHO2_01_FULL_37_17]|nr:MAG: single-stranded-DNA-specific exonuclease RecJ [Candidatus Levybacteria bacterium RIFCSPHIGHO2_01_FULL_37_17]OGH37162.1 MAG: single-stranded-DNA-specific exonuclease RecJ [Candidatus Levybacteria bacterium RIFCSPLOWO2_01_FULL_38_23]
MKKWNLLHQVESQNSKVKNDDILDILLENRGIKTKKEKENFLTPKFKEVTIASVEIDKKHLKKATARIKKAINNKEKIIIFGDYDVDGIAASAILWETLNNLGANVLPYIPSRFEEGYGLSIKGIDNVLAQNSDLKLIITVDNGIVANVAIDYANKKGVDVIITDHHVKPVNSKLPKAFAIIHTTLLCGAGVAYFLSKDLKNETIDFPDSHLELVALATIADLVSLKDGNRVFVRFGIEALRKTKRPGLLSLFSKADIDKDEIGVYQVGHIIAPRLNAMGRLTNAMDSLRLICTSSVQRANDLANTLAKTNLERQEITAGTLDHALSGAKKNLLKKLIFIADKSYKEGVIGLVAGRLVEEYYLPSIVISKGKKYSKASARSVLGFNIVEFLREASDLLVDVGGHPMAAGFTVETKNLAKLEKFLYEKVSKLISKDHLERKLNIDLILPEDLIGLDLYSYIQKLSPFGMANPEPTFLTHNLRIFEIKKVGRDGKHLKLKLNTINGARLDAIAFGMGDSKLKIGDAINVVYTFSVDEWNGNKKLQLKVKDFKTI